VRSAENRANQPDLEDALLDGIVHWLFASAHHARQRRSSRAGEGGLAPGRGPALILCALSEIEGCTRMPALRIYSLDGARPSRGIEVQSTFSRGSVGGLQH